MNTLHDTINTTNHPSKPAYSQHRSLHKDPPYISRPDVQWWCDPNFTKYYASAPCLARPGSPVQSQLIKSGIEMRMQRVMITWRTHLDVAMNPASPQTSEHHLKKRLKLWFLTSNFLEKKVNAKKSNNPFLRKQIKKLRRDVSLLTFMSKMLPTKLFWRSTIRATRDA